MYVDLCMYASLCVCLCAVFMRVSWEASVNFISVCVFMFVFISIFMWPRDGVVTMKSWPPKRLDAL